MPRTGPLRDWMTPCKDLCSKQISVCFYASDNLTAWCRPSERHLSELYSLRVNSTSIEGMLNSAIYNQNIVQVVLLSFLQQGGEVPFQQDNVHPHYTHVIQNIWQSISYNSRLHLLFRERTLNIPHIRWENCSTSSAVITAKVIMYINRYKRHWIMHHRIVLTICMFVSIQVVCVNEKEG